MMMDLEEDNFYVPESWDSRQRNEKRKRDDFSFSAMNLSLNSPKRRKLDLPEQVEPQRIPLIVKTLSGRFIHITVLDSDKVESIKLQIFEKEGIPLPNQRLIFNGKHLADEKYMFEYGVVKNSVIHLVLALRGGATHRSYDQEMPDSHSSTSHHQPIPHLTVAIRRPLKLGKKE